MIQLHACRLAQHQAARLFSTDEVKLRAEFADLLCHDDTSVFLIQADGLPVGFTQCQLRRDSVESTSTSPMGYWESIYVDGAFRRRDATRNRFFACENWASGMGCMEFASDREQTNDVSAAFHTAIGFKETNRIIRFTQSLK